MPWRSSCCWCALTPSSIYANDKDAPGAARTAKADSKDDKSPAKDDDIKLPPFPADKTIHQTMQLGGRTLKYDATVGSLPVFDEKGKQVASVMFTAYTVAGPGCPVTFALNGGPGASSVYLNLGAIGPKRVQFGAEGNSPSDPATPLDNPGTWLDFTDLVFIDPVGTGFSYSRSRRTMPRSAFITPNRTSNICRASFSTGWSRMSASPRASTWSARATAAFGSTHHALPADTAGCRDARHGAGVALSRSWCFRQRRSLAPSLDAHAAEHCRCESRAPRQAE